MASVAYFAEALRTMYGALFLLMIEVLLNKTHAGEVNRASTKPTIPSVGALDAVCLGPRGRRGVLVGV